MFSGAQVTKGSQEDPGRPQGQLETSAGGASRTQVACFAALLKRRGGPRDTRLPEGSARSARAPAVGPEARVICTLAFVSRPGCRDLPGAAPSLPRGCQGPTLVPEPGSGSSGSRRSLQPVTLGRLRFAHRAAPAPPRCLPGQPVTSRHSHAESAGMHRVAFSVPKARRHRGGALTPPLRAVGLTPVPEALTQFSISEMGPSAFFAGRMEDIGEVGAEAWTSGGDTNAGVTQGP